MTKAKSAYWQHIIDAAQKHPQVAGLDQLPFFTLAPMEAVTDTVFRRVVAAAAAPEAFYTEFTNARSISHPKAKFTVQGRLCFVPEEASIPIAQLWGDRPIDFELGSIDLKERGFEALDINMGCPDSTVIKNGGGSDLIRHPEKVPALIAAAKTAGLPVSVKTRLGFNRVETYKEWLPLLLEQDIEVLTIHLRSRKEMSKVPAHFEYIDDILKMRDAIAPHTLIQINGDIKDRAQGLALAKAHPGLDGIMIGRGIFENPYAFSDTPTEHTLTDSLNLLRMQLDLHDDFVTNFWPSNFQKLKRFFKIYVRNFSYASDLRIALMDTNSTDDARQILDTFDQQWQAKQEQKLD